MIIMMIILHVNIVPKRFGNVFSATWSACRLKHVVVSCLLCFKLNSEMQVVEMIVRPRSRKV